jgi:hypothetical protein
METGEKYFGNYRAIVVDNNDTEMYGRVMVWIPDIMPKVKPNKGLWAYPANNPIGGRNSENEDAKFDGSSYIPEKGSWVWIFFEAGNPNRPYYFAALDIKGSLVLPECQVGSEPYRKWVIFKSRSGRCIVISDDEDDCRVEITGKKRQITSKPSGDKGSVYTIDGNQTTILLDEREGKEKLLIRTYQGDFLNIDTENRTLNIKFQSDIQIKSNGKINIEASDDINIKTSGDLNESAAGDVNVKASGNTNMEASTNISVKGGPKAKIQSALTSIKSDGDLKIGGSTLQIAASLVVGPIYQLGSGTPPDPADSASDAESANPVGERD